MQLKVCHGVTSEMPVEEVMVNASIMHLSTAVDKCIMLSVMY